MEIQTESDYRLWQTILVSKRELSNPKNFDHRSFGHAIMFALNPKNLKEY